jgi:hypothetical protein
VPWCFNPGKCSMPLTIFCSAGHTGAVSTVVSALTKEVLFAMTMKKFTIAGLFVFATLVGGSAYLATATASDAPKEAKKVEFTSVEGLVAKTQAGQSILLDCPKKTVYLTIGDDTKGDVTFHIVNSTLVLRGGSGEVAGLAEIAVGDRVRVVYEQGSQEIRCIVVGVTALWVPARALPAAGAPPPPPRLGAPGAGVAPAVPPKN